MRSSGRRGRLTLCWPSSKGLARRRPVLIVLEDAHWIDATTTELFDVAIDRLQRLPVLLVVTFRPEFQPPWTTHAQATMLTLNRLGARQATAIVEQVSGGKALPSGGARADPHQDRRGAALRRGAYQGGAGTRTHERGGRPVRARRARCRRRPSRRPCTARSWPASTDWRPSRRSPRSVRSSGGSSTPATRGGRIAVAEDQSELGVRGADRGRAYLPPRLAARGTYVFKHALVQEAALREPAQDQAPGVARARGPRPRGAVSTTWPPRARRSSPTTVPSAGSSRRQRCTGGAPDKLPWRSRRRRRLSATFARRSTCSRIFRLATSMRRWSCRSALRWAAR